MTASDDPLSDPALRSQLDRLLVLVAAHAPIRTAIVHPCDAGSLRGAMEAARMQLIAPVLIGPVARIAAAAAQAGEDLDLSRFCSGQMLMLCGPLFEGHG